MDYQGTPRPRPRWHHASTELDDFTIVSYRAEPGLVARYLPSGVVPEVLSFDDGGRDTLISAVVFSDRDFHFRFCPPVSISCGQVNYRAYVRSGGERGAWFFGTALDHPLVVVPRMLWQMPWHRAQIRIGAQDGQWHMTAADSSGTSHCELSVTGDALGRLDGFTDAGHTLQTLTHPTDGWYRRRNGTTGHYSIWHDVMAARPAAVTSARFTFLEALGLITPSSQPHSALTQPTIHFDIHTPPRRQRPNPLPAAAQAQPSARVDGGHVPAAGRRRYRKSRQVREEATIRSAQSNSLSRTDGGRLPQPPQPLDCRTATGGGLERRGPRISPRPGIVEVHPPRVKRKAFGLAKASVRR